MTPTQRFRELNSKGLCYQCLYPGSQYKMGKHSVGNCQTVFTCKHPSHDKYSRKKHVLVCHEHRDTEENKALLEEYKEKCILHQKIPLPDFSREIKLTFLAHQSYTGKTDSDIYHADDDEPITENGIYILQTIQVNKQRFTLFFDSGCSDMVSRYDAIQRIGARAKQEIKGPINLGGVGAIKTVSQHGVY